MFFQTPTSLILNTFTLVLTVKLMNSGQILLFVALFIVMLGMGLSLVPDDFKRIFRYPKAAAVGLINQMILLPLIAFAVLWLIPAQPEIAVGLIILAACPGGPTSNLITNLSKGDVALSVSLTAMSSVLAIFTIPFIVKFGMVQFMNQEKVIQVDTLKMIGEILLVTIIPIATGMTIRAKNAAFADKMEKPVKITSAIVLAAVIAVIILKEQDNFLSYFEKAGVVSLLLNAGTMLVGFITSRLFFLSREQSITVSIESGIQNGTLAIAIAISVLQNPQFSITPAVYSLIMFGTGAIMIAVFGRKKVTVPVKA